MDEYFATGDPVREELLKDFGKHKSGKGCVYINKLEDINIDILRKIIKQSIKFLNDLYPQK